MNASPAAVATLRTLLTAQHDDGIGGLLVHDFTFTAAIMRGVAARRAGIFQLAPHSSAGYIIT